MKKVKLSFHAIILFLIGVISIVVLNGCVGRSVKIETYNNCSTIGQFGIDASLSIYTLNNPGSNEFFMCIGNECKSKAIVDYTSSFEETNLIINPIIGSNFIFTGIGRKVLFSNEEGKSELRQLKINMGGDEYWVSEESALYLSADLHDISCLKR